MDHVEAANLDILDSSKAPVDARPVVAAHRPGDKSDVKGPSNVAIQLSPAKCRIDVPYDGTSDRWDCVDAVESPEHRSPRTGEICRKSDDHTWATTFLFAFTRVRLPHDECTVALREAIQRVASRRHVRRVPSPGIILTGRRKEMIHGRFELSLHTGARNPYRAVRR